MAGTTGLGTTFNLPNYHGELIALTPADTPLLSAAGGLGGGKQTTSTSFEWSTYDLRSPEIRARLEGGDAPTAEERVRANVENVVQIFHESIATSYTKQAAIGQYATAQSAPFYSPDGEPNPVTDEHSWQVMQALKTIGRDVNFTFWHGKLNKPADNSTARQTRGLLQAISTTRQATGEVTDATSATDTITKASHGLANGDRVVFTDTDVATGIRVDRAYYVVNQASGTFKVSATSGGAAITLGTAAPKYIKAAATLDVDKVNGLIASVFDNGGMSQGDARTLFVSSTQRRAITKAYVSGYGSTAGVMAGERTVGGVAVDTILTDFGPCNVVVDRDVPPDAIVAASLEQIHPVFLSIPGKGLLFEEELAKTGASSKTQVYGEIGLQYGNERAHGVLRGLAV